MPKTAEHVAEPCRVWLVEGAITGSPSDALIRILANDVAVERLPGCDYLAFLQGGQVVACFRTWLMWCREDALVRRDGQG